MTTVLEKLKALDAQRAQLLEGAKKEALDNAEKAVAELNELGFHYTLTEGASPQSQHRAPRKACRSSSKAPSRETCPALYAISKRPRITMAGCTGHKRPKAIQRRGIDGEAFGEGWVVSTFADAQGTHRRSSGRQPS